MWSYVEFAGANRRVRTVLARNHHPDRKAKPEEPHHHPLDDGTASIASGRVSSWEPFRRAEAEGWTERAGAEPTCEPRPKEEVVSSESFRQGVAEGSIEVVDLGAKKPAPCMNEWLRKDLRDGTATIEDYPSGGGVVVTGVPAPPKK